MRWLLTLFEVALAAGPDAAPPAPDGPGAIDVCGNGRIGARSYLRECAPCAVGNVHCPCAWMANMEQCDGADLGGASCEKLGFVGGKLKCGPDCTLDKSECEIAAHGRVTSSSASGLLAGRDFALARNGDVLGVASTETGIVRFMTVDPLLLRVRTAESRWSPPLNYPKGVNRFDQLTRSWADPLWSPVLAASGDGFLLAVEQAAYSAYLILSFRPSGPLPVLGAPVASLPGRRPRFLAPGKGGALLGFERNGLWVVRVDPNGAFVDPPLELPVKPRQVAFQAAAAWTGDGWTIVAGPEHANNPEVKLNALRLNADGTLGTSRVLDVRGVVGTVIPVRDGVLAGYADEQGPALLSLDRDVTPGIPLRLDAPGLGPPLAIESDGDTTVTWASGPGGIARIASRHNQPTRALPLFAVPGKLPRAAVIARSVFHVLFAADIGDPSPVIEVAR